MVYYLPLEPYQERYTLQLKDWTLRAFERNGVDKKNITVIEPFGFGSNAIIQNVGPLDYWRRTRWSLLQMEQLLAILEQTKTGSMDAIYFQDMFHPGIEALAYIFAQKSCVETPRIYVQNCAQSMDIYDFTYPMMNWMRPYERMVDNFVTGVFVASTVHAELMRVAEFNAPIYVTGLPFDKDEVRERLGGGFTPWDDKMKRVVFTSRFDREKQPHFFLDLVDEVDAMPEFDDVSFEILQGGVFNSNDPSAVKRARRMEQECKLTIREKLSKEEYYEILDDSKIQINTALQDFVSNTLNEASAFGVKSLVPCFRSFPEAVNSNSKFMYAPFNMDDVVCKLKSLLSTPFSDDVFFPSEIQHESLDYVAKIVAHDEICLEDYRGI